ncbi:aldo/keto reductase [Phenylobacterium sp. J367]|uniref:aldo/keto reductase n=1 Tax=Phenylobacterium sp. J367 TaxID=2898435 RepID=UPI0021509320|nr:aldo/keto reductase [Phenylobacterium sp. J367]MCR5879256.1 aldo/keto reductase [Phenylobacterium sp. J367]
MVYSSRQREGHFGAAAGASLEQHLYNLIERRAELEVIPACRAYGVGVITWSPLAGGLLAGGAAEPGGRRGSEEAKQAASARAEQLARFGTLCEALGHSPSAVALAWLLHQPGITSTIIGPRNLHQLSSVLHVPDLRLDADTLARIDDIFPSCGEAPEAYSW